jgi:hypothetical protein
MIKASNRNITSTDMMKEVSQRWNSLSEEERVPFVKQASEDRLRFEKEIEEYKVLESSIPPKVVSNLGSPVSTCSKSKSLISEIPQEESSCTVSEALVLTPNGN